MTREQIRIAPEVLRWARKRARFSIGEMRRKFRHIQSWEQGSAFPTYPQLERLATAYRIPVAVLFFPEPPDVPPIRESFRTLPDARFDSLPRGIHFLLRKAAAFRINLEDLNDGRNPAENFILQDLDFSPNTDVPAMARRVREYLGVTLDVQTGWTDSETAFNEWREVLEAHGVAVFKDAFRDESCSGFCLYDAIFPLVFVNNAMTTRQISTLFHELAHLLFRTSGIDMPENDPGGNLPLPGRRIEIACSRFAAEFLLPAERFTDDARGLPPTAETATLLAERYHVPRESIFRRFLDRGDITREEHARAAAEWSGQRRAGSGGNFYLTKIADLGKNYIGLAFSRYYQNRISEPELADYLDIDAGHLGNFEDHFLRSVA